jgi:hypothetical protein
LKAAKGSSMEMLGYNKALEWTDSGDGMVVNFPDKLRDEKKRPCEHAWILKITQSL